MHGNLSWGEKHNKRETNNDNNVNRKNSIVIILKGREPVENNLWLLVLECLVESLQQAA